MITQKEPQLLKYICVLTEHCCWKFNYLISYNVIKYQTTSHCLTSVPPLHCSILFHYLCPTHWRSTNQELAHSHKVSQLLKKTKYLGIMEKTNNKEVHTACVIYNPHPYNPLLSTEAMASLAQQTVYLKDITLSFLKTASPGFSSHVSTRRLQDLSICLLLLLISLFVLFVDQKIRPQSPPILGIMSILLGDLSIFYQELESIPLPLESRLVWTCFDQQQVAKVT